MVKTKYRYSEKRNLLKEFKLNPNSEILLELANYYEMTLVELKEKLEYSCFDLGNLNVTHLRELRKDIRSMTIAEIRTIERINGTSIKEVIENINIIVTDYLLEKEIKKDIKALSKERDIEIECEFLEKVAALREVDCFLKVTLKLEMIEKKAKMHKIIEEEVRRIYEFVKIE